MVFKPLMPANPIEQHLEQSKADLERAQDNMDKIRRAYQETENRLSAAQATYDAFLASHTLIENAAKKPKRKRLKKAPSIATVETQKMFNAIYAQYGLSEFGYDEIEHVARRNGLDFNPVNIRSSMSDYVKAGHIDRPSNGRFVLRDAGKAFFGITDASSVELSENQILDAAAERARQRLQSRNGEGRERPSPERRVKRGY